MAELTDYQKAFIVQKLACYHTPAEVRDALKETFGVEAESNQLARYNPTLKSGAALSDGLKAQFERDRAAYLEGKEIVPITLRHFRQRELLDMYRAAKAKKNYVLAAKLLEQAAKEAGGIYERPQEAQSGGDPNAIPQSLEDAVTKVYGEPNAAQPDPAGSGNANGSGSQRTPGSGS